MIWHQPAFLKLFPFPFFISQGSPNEQNQLERSVSPSIYIYLFTIIYTYNEIDSHNYEGW